MQRAYRISLFYIAGIAVIALVILVYSHLSKDNQNNIAEPEIVTETKPDTLIASEDSVAIVSQQICLTSDSLVSYIDHYLDIDLCSEKRIIPQEYIGKDREGIISLLDEELQNPNELNIEKGLFDYNILRFSSSEIVIERFYSNVEQKFFYLGIVNDYIVVFHEDKETIYLNTGIVASELPHAILSEIENWKLINGINELFDFLEAYTS